MSRANIWVNSDGLNVGNGTHSSDNNCAGVVSVGNLITVKQEITLADAVDVAVTGTALPQAHVIPRGSIFESATVQTLVAATGSSSTLDIGTFSRGLATEVVDDAIGILDAGTIAEMTTVGEIQVCDGSFLPKVTGVTGMAGAISNSDVVIVYSWDTAAFTAGVILLTVTYTAPFGSAGRSIAV
jgi:hypothetical protein